MTTVAPTPAVRPPAVLAIGWLFVAFGALMMLSGVVGMIAAFVIIPEVGKPLEMPEAPLPFRMLARLLDHYGWVAAGQFALAVAMISSGVAFLRLRPWARTAIEALTWLAIAYELAFGGVWVWAGVRDGGPFAAMFIAVGASAIVMYGIPLAVILRVVRGDSVRTTFAPAQPTG